MSSIKFSSQISWDLDRYLPITLEFEEILNFQSVEALLTPIDSNNFESPHRMELKLFDPLPNDSNASIELMNSEVSNNYYIDFDSIDIDDILYEGSNVVPHIGTINNKEIQYNEKPTSTRINKMNQTSRMQVNLPKQYSTPIDSNDIKKFLIRDESTARLRRPLLHEFIRLLLDRDEYSHIVEYIDRKRGIFKLHRPDDVAALWKTIKGRNSDNNMTYDKLARALRYYYGNGIMHPNPGRFTFRFGCKSGFGITWWPAYL